MSCWSSSDLFNRKPRDGLSRIQLRFWKRHGQSEAGIGWQGKHSIVINKKIGSFFFIGALILNIELEYDKPVTEDYCGNCRLCIEQCPTGAINENRTIDATKVYCKSYY